MRNNLRNLVLHITDGEHSSVSDCSDGEFWLLGNKNLINGSIAHLPNDRRISEKAFKDIRRRTQLSDGDVLISTVGTIGKVAIAHNTHNIEFQRSVGIIKCDTTKLLPEYLAYYFSLPGTQQRLQQLSKGAVQKCLFISDLEDFTIDYPSITEQLKIIKPLLNIDEQIQRNNAMVHKLRFYGHVASRFSGKEKTRNAA